MSKPKTTRSPTEINCPRCLTCFKINQNPEGRKLRCTVCGHAYIHIHEENKKLKKADPMVDKMFGKCRVTKLLAKGGMGRVYLAHHELLNSKVAIKTLTGKLLDNPAFIDRFYREAKVAAKIHHPNIVSVIDCGKENDRHYIMMEFVDGLTLRELVEQKGPQDEITALSLMKQVVKALAHAHSLNIIHRDIKPANIMVTTSGEVKLADMGLARSTKLEEDDKEITQSGAAIGTPAYMSPEQAIDATTLNFQSDIYSLGVSFYFFVCGANPFTGRSHFELLKKAAQEPAPSILDYNIGISNNYSKIIETMMGKKPSDRYKSYDLLMEAIDKQLQNINNGNADDTLSPETIQRINSIRKVSAPEQQSEPISQYISTNLRNKKPPIWAWALTVVAVIVLILAALTIIDSKDVEQREQKKQQGNPLLRENAKLPETKTPQPMVQTSSRLDIEKYFNGDLKSNGKTITLSYKADQHGVPVALSNSENLIINRGTLSSMKPHDRVYITAGFEPENFNATFAIGNGKSFEMGILNPSGLESIGHVTYDHHKKNIHATWYGTKKTQTITPNEVGVNTLGYQIKNKQLHLTFNDKRLLSLVSKKTPAIVTPYLSFAHPQSSGLQAITVTGKLSQTWLDSWKNNPKCNFINRYGNRHWLHPKATAWEISRAIRDEMKPKSDEFSYAWKLCRHLYPNGIWWKATKGLTDPKKSQLFLEKIANAPMSRAERSAALNHASEHLKGSPDVQALANFHLAATESSAALRIVKYNAALKQVKSPALKTNIKFALAQAHYRRQQYPRAMALLKQVFQSNTLTSVMHKQAMALRKKIVKHHKK